MFMFNWFRNSKSPPTKEEEAAKKKAAEEGLNPILPKGLVDLVENYGEPLNILHIINDLKADLIKLRQEVKQTEKDAGVLEIKETAINEALKHLNSTEYKVGDESKLLAFLKQTDRAYRDEIFGYVEAANPAFDDVPRRRKGTGVSSSPRWDYIRLLAYDTGWGRFVKLLAKYQEEVTKIAASSVASTSNSHKVGPK